MIPTEYIVEVTNNVLATMLQCDAIPSPDESPSPNEGHITGCVQISGAWTGAVLVQTSHEFASRAACKLLQIASEDLVIADLQDTMAELTNMIGGNIKSVVPGPSFLSLPSVMTGKDFNFRLLGTEIVKTVPFECDGEEVQVLLCQEISPS